MKSFVLANDWLSLLTNCGYHRYLGKLSLRSVVLQLWPLYSTINITREPVRSAHFQARLTYWVRCSGCEASTLGLDKSSWGSDAHPSLGSTALVLPCIPKQPSTGAAFHFVLGACGNGQFPNPRQIIQPLRGSFTVLPFRDFYILDPLHHGCAFS